MVVARFNETSTLLSLSIPPPARQRNAHARDDIYPCCAPQKTVRGGIHTPQAKACPEVPRRTRSPWRLRARCNVWSLLKRRRLVTALLGDFRQFFIRSLLFCKCGLQQRCGILEFQVLGHRDQRAIGDFHQPKAVSRNIITPKPSIKPRVAGVS